MAGAHRRPQRRNLAVSTWLGTGVAAVGVSAALLGSAAVASAAPSTDSESAASSAPAQAKKPPAQKPAKNKKKDTAAVADASDTKATSDTKPASDTQPADTKAADGDNDAKPARNRRTKADNTGRSATAPNAGTVAKLPSAAAQAVTNNPSTKNPLKSAAAVKPATDTAAKDTASPAAATPAAAATPSPAPAATPPVTVAAAETSTAAITSIPNTAAKALSSVTSPTAPANISGLLSVLAAVGQALGAATLATEETLAASVVGTTKTVSKLLGITPALATTTEKTSAASTLTPAPTETWQPGQTVTADEYINTALTEIAQARTLLGTSWVNGYSRYELRMAATYLTTYQANQQTLMDAYAANPTATNLSALKSNEALIGKAVTALKTARYWSANRDIKAIIVDATTNARIYASVPLSMYAGVEPIVTISVNGGPKIKVLVDTGSSGLVVNAKNVGQTGLGESVSSGTGGYSGGLTYTYDTYNTTVNFGSGIVTAPTSVNVITDPAQQAAFAKFLANNGVVGVLGVGTNAVGPGPGLVTTGLPGALKNGIYIDEVGRKLTFGPNPLPARVTTSGSPNVIGSMTVNGVNTPINLLVDSGGVYGTIPSTMVDSSQLVPIKNTDGTVAYYVLKAGVPISVYDADGNLLYTFTTTSSYRPTVTFDDYNAELSNTGAMPFLHNRIYIDYSTANGSTVFDL
ncbi:PecA family PE domain-processing aspartic protease [Mycobacterium sp. SMC-17]|uniref:PecA family PE domain-processing aspartic protease n=1 Tax=Mycobacterium sp. SMC-17 TaxID=3381628 RepID=UPI003876DF3E